VKNITLHVTVLLAAFASEAVASELSYACVIEHVYSITSYEDEKNTELIPSYLEENFLGGQFSVSRLSGEIIGEVLPTMNATSTKVIHQGSSSYSFKTIAFFKDQVQVLEIKEFIGGNEKPFIAMSMGGAGIVTGLCK
jgi:hypothetical protein